MNKILNHYIIVSYIKLKSFYNRRRSYPTIIIVSAIDESEYTKLAPPIYIAGAFLPIQQFRPGLGLIPRFKRIVTPVKLSITILSTV
jgi:hypothetical protein